MGVIGCVIDGTHYYYAKNMFGDVVALIRTSDNTIVAQYVYDAWGNHKVYDSNGNENTDPYFVGNLNPIRYRSYYWDNDIGMYYLHTRWYDPEVGRFINLDQIEYLDPQTVNGLNLYAYCLNNPVMGVDPDGTASWLYWVISIGVAIASIALTVVTAGAGVAIAATVAGTVVGGLYGGINAVRNDQDILQGVMIGMLNGITMANTAATGAFTINQGLLLGNSAMVANGFKTAAIGGFMGGGLTEFGTQLANSQSIDMYAITDSAIKNGFLNSISAVTGAYGEFYQVGLIESGVFSYISGVFIETTSIIIDLIKKLCNS